MCRASQYQRRVIGTPEVDISRTIGGELERAALADPDRTLLRCAGRDVVAAALERRSRFVAGALQAWGVGPGVRVAVMMGNVPEFLEVRFGIVLA